MGRAIKNPRQRLAPAGVWKTAIIVLFLWAPLWRDNVYDAYQYGYACQAEDEFGQRRVHVAVLGETLARTTISPSITILLQIFIGGKG